MNVSSSNKFVWDVFVSAQGYEWKLVDGGGTDVVPITSTPGTEVPASDVLPGLAYNSYTFYVRAVEAAGPGAWAGLSFTYVALPAPMNLRVE